MKHYAVINNEVIKLLSLDDIYRYYVLRLMPSKNNCTNTTINQLSKILNESERSLERFPQRLRNTNLVKVDLVKKEKRRLNYYFSDGENYRMILNSLLLFNISNTAKGLLIALCCLTINNINKCLLSKNKIINNLKASKPIVLKAFKELENTKSIDVVKDGFLLPKTVLKLGEKKIVEDLFHLINSNKICKQSIVMDYYIKNPNKVNNIENLSLFLLTGVRYKS